MLSDCWQFVRNCWRCSSEWDGCCAIRFQKEFSYFAVFLFHSISTNAGVFWASNFCTTADIWGLIYLNSWWLFKKGFHLQILLNFKAQEHDYECWTGYVNWCWRIWRPNFGTAVEEYLVKKTTIGYNVSEDNHDNESEVIPLWPCPIEFGITYALVNR